MSLSLELRDLVVRSKCGLSLLEVEKLDVPPGSLVGIEGPSGAGKSTLLFALAGLLDDVSGWVRWGECELNGMTQAQRAAFRAKAVGMVFQDFMLFEELNASANAAIAGMFRSRTERGPLRERAEKTLHTLGLDETASRLVSSYSGGERQRIAVARALANDAAILLADEPTANLHRKAADKLIHDISRLVRESGKTLIAVSHDAALLDQMDRVLTIENGMIVRDTYRDAV